MRALVLLTAATVALCNVHEVTPDNFDATVWSDDLDLTLVKFYAPWCGHCKAMKQPYIKASEALAEKNPRIRLAEANVDEHRSLGERFQIDGFPTLLLFRRGSTVGEPYEGGRDEDAIVTYLQQASEPAVTIHPSETELKEWAEAHLQKTGSVVVTGTITTTEDWQAFEDFANQVRRTLVVGGVMAAGRQVIVLHKPGEEPVVYDGPVTAYDLNQWAKASRFKLYEEITRDNFRDYHERKLPLVWSFLQLDSPTRADHDATMRKVAAKYPGKASFVWIDGNSFNQMAKQLGLAADTLPAVAVEWGKKHYAYPTEGVPADEAELSQWMAGVLEGTMEPTVKSQPEPATNPDENGVWVLTGHTFEKETFESGKDVLIEFYAPWCGHCKQLEPEYNKLATQLKDVSTVRIAKVDGTANDVLADEFEYQGFPTLFFIKAGKDGERGTVLKYNGGRTTRDLLDFITENAAHPVNV